VEEVIADQTETASKGGGPGQSNLKAGKYKLEKNGWTSMIKPAYTERKKEEVYKKRVNRPYGGKRIKSPY